MGNLVKHHPRPRNQRQADGFKPLKDALGNTLLLLVFAAELAVLYSFAFTIFMKFH